MNPLTRAKIEAVAVALETAAAKAQADAARQDAVTATVAQVLAAERLTVAGELRRILAEAAFEDDITGVHELPPQKGGNA